MSRHDFATGICAGLLAGALLGVALSPAKATFNTLGPVPKPYVLLPSTTEAVTILEPDRPYDFVHDGEDGSGVAATQTIYLSITAAVDADQSAGDDKVKLTNGRTVRIGPGFSQVKYKVASATAVPTLSVVPGRAALGQY